MGTSAIVMMCVGIVAIWGGLAINLYISIKRHKKTFEQISKKD
ncbi:MAG TPA: methionine/alanine import family NSS transporter small subunit [Firmicutes bacterium]|nr:methionine/alanine import family NSS transporter small subunit [Bacillales bacterium]HJA41957.1 methionine/alanine import family NSS transporter small subunit [Bacillota bacterium]